MLPFVAVDFETEFDESLSVKIQGNHNYGRLTHAFNVGLYSQDPEIQYSGPLEEAPWYQLHGLNWVAHNVSFDSAIFYAARDFHRQVPSYIEPRSWDCTADLSVAMLLGRSLKAALKSAFGIEYSKSIRDKMKGKYWPDSFTPDQQQEIRNYCFEDTRWCWRLWRAYSDQWPLPEREFARIIRTRCAQGVTVDQAALENGIARMQELRDQAEDRIPWATGGEKCVVLSHKAVREYCVAQHIPPPESLAEDSIACGLWEAKYGERYPIVGALRDYRKANIYLRKLEAMRHRLMANGRMTIELKYNGAVGTGRLSGAGGWNIQNLPRTEYQGVDVRKLLIAAPGKKFVIADFCQIEPVVSAWLTNNHKALEALKIGFNVYEAEAKSSGVWDGPPGTFKKADPAGYQLMKAQFLGIGYGMGPDRLKTAAKVQLKLELPRDHCQELIRAWHRRNSGVKAMWRELDTGLRQSLARGENFSVELPSGRFLQYFDLQLEGSRISARPSKDGIRKFFWGGALFENVIQSIARDVLRDAVLRLEAAGIPVLFTAHDEVVCEVSESFITGRIEELLIVPPDWAFDLPLAAEVIETHAYTK